MNPPGQTTFPDTRLIAKLMDCHQLAHRIQAEHPTAGPREVARLCLLLTNAAGDLECLEDEATLASTWRDVKLRVQANSDQHAAMTDELDQLARSDPKRFTSDQIWILIRAIKVQSQLLQMYIGEDARMV